MSFFFGGGEAGKRKVPSFSTERREGRGAMKSQYVDRPYLEKEWKSTGGCDRMRIGGIEMSVTSRKEEGMKELALKGGGGILLFGWNTPQQKEGLLH